MRAPPHIDDGERRTIAELLARYEFEPSLRDVYVEGSFDLRFLRWFFGQIEEPDIKVYSIDAVEIPSSTVESRGVSDGARGRVFTLSLELHENGVAETQVACVIDTDLDKLLDVATDHPLLLRTDYTCMEMYLVNSATLGKFLELAIGLTSPGAEDLIKEMASVLREAFLTRVGGAALGILFNWLSVERCCSLGVAGIEFDRDDFLTRLLHKNAMHDTRSPLEVKIAEFRGRLGKDVRTHMHGHDFTELLAWYLNRRNVRELGGAKGVARLLLGCVELSVIADEGLFQELRRRLT